MTANSAQFAARTVADDDLDLVHASKNGDVAAFEQLVKRYDRKLLRIAHNVTHNTEDSQDAVQETFLKAFQHLGQFREDSKFSTWLIRITVNQSLMKLRKRAIREVSLDEDFQADGDMLPMETADWTPNPEQLYWASELRNILANTLSELRPVLRAVFVLRDIEGLSTDQTAEVLNLSHTAVKARLWRARLQLRERLNKFIEQGGASLYPTLLFKATDPEVLRILVSIGGVEIDHFGLWHDKAGNAVNQPLAGVTDPVTGLTFPDLNARNSELDQTNLILPEPCEFISKSLPPCSVIRPTLTQNGGAVATIKAFTDDLLFVGQIPAFFSLVNQLAVEADSVRRGF